MQIEGLDHLVLTVADIPRTVAFYRDVLGMVPVTFGEGRVALAFGRHKINLHPAAAPLLPHARVPQAGSADLCLIVAGELDEVAAELAAKGVAIELGPVARTGALGPIRSLYLRDPDGNLLELSVYA
ncbi:VOC family protein [Vogesella indigofera]|uniref:VOC family protein n=1 Tax=Vogesella indigofera TaxID=45465 RepID=UPI00234EC7EB|nr:VOC family protein [Vogesella indigofera]MDC7709546.1 VOC family protein [Vogesella indigofera]